MTKTTRRNYFRLYKAVRSITLTAGGADGVAHIRQYDGLIRRLQNAYRYGEADAHLLADAELVLAN